MVFGSNFDPLKPPKSLKNKLFFNDFGIFVGLEGEIDGLIHLAEQEGCLLLYTVTENPGLHKRYVKYHGLSKGENNARTFVKDLTNGKYGPLLWAKSQQVLDEEQDNSYK